MVQPATRPGRISVGGWLRKRGVRPSERLGVLLNPFASRLPQPSVPEEPGDWSEDREQNHGDYPPSHHGRACPVPSRDLDNSHDDQRQQASEDDGGQGYSKKGVGQSRPPMWWSPASPPRQAGRTTAGLQTNRQSLRSRRSCRRDRASRSWSIRTGCPRLSRSSPCTCHACSSCRTPSRRCWRSSPRPRS